MKKIIMISALFISIGSKALSQTWWLRRVDSNVHSNTPGWSSPLISLKECEAARNRISNMIDRNNSISDQLVCHEGE